MLTYGCLRSGLVTKSISLTKNNLFIFFLIVGQCFLKKNKKLPYLL